MANTSKKTGSTGTPKATKVRGHKGAHMSGDDSAKSKQNTSRRTRSTVPKAAKQGRFTVPPGTTVH
jgi:hypothetical protein